MIRAETECSSVSDEKPGGAAKNSFQPDSRYWLFLDVEAGVPVALAVGLAALAIWLLRPLTGLSDHRDGRHAAIRLSSGRLRHAW
jgi:hypothetical protein